MTDTWLADRLTTLAATPAPTELPLQPILAQGRRVRRRRVRVVAGAVVLAVVGAGVAGGAVISRRSTASLTVAGFPDEGLHAPYWHVRDDGVGYYMRDGVPVTYEPSTTVTWWGNGRRSLGGQELHGALVNVSPEGGDFEDWQSLWDAPTDARGLTDYIEHIRFPGSTALELADDTARMLTEPAPQALRHGLISLLEAQPRAMLSSGHDANGRPATVITVPQANPDAQVTVYYVDGSTDQLLEQEYLARKPAEASDLPQGHVESYDVYTEVGPVASAPPLSPAPSPTPPPAPGTAEHPTCPTFTPDDPTDAVDVQLAQICLLDPAPVFSVRKSPDSHSGDTGDAFTVADGKGDSVLLQVDGNDQFFLTLAESPTPKDGKVGDDPYVGSIQVLGVTASEVTDSDGGRGLVLEKDGLGIEAFGGPKTSYQDLATLVGALRGIAPARS